VITERRKWTVKRGQGGIERHLAGKIAAAVLARWEVIKAQTYQKVRGGRFRAEVQEEGVVQRTEPQKAESWAIRVVDNYAKIGERRKSLLTPYDQKRSTQR